MMMTFTEDPEFDKEQLRRFTALCGVLEREGVELGRRHAASSFALFQRPDAFLDMVRPGWRSSASTRSRSSARPACSTFVRRLRSSAGSIYVKQLQAGESAGYNRAYVGEGDGLDGHAPGGPCRRAATRGGEGRARAHRRAPLPDRRVGVSQPHASSRLALSAVPRFGDVATFFDWADGSRPEDVGAACGVVGLRPDDAPQPAAAAPGGGIRLKPDPTRRRRKRIRLSAEPPPAVAPRQCFTA